MKFTPLFALLLLFSTPAWAEFRISSHLLTGLRIATLEYRLDETYAIGYEYGRDETKIHHGLLSRAYLGGLGDGFFVGASWIFINDVANPGQFSNGSYTEAGYQWRWDHWDQELGITVYSDGANQPSAVNRMPLIYAVGYHF